MTKTHTPKQPKPTKKAPVFKSDRSWGGKVILTGETVDPKVQHGTPSIPAEGFKNAQSFVDAEGWVHCYVDGRLVARYQTEEAKSAQRKKDKENSENE